MNAKIVITLLCATQLVAGYDLTAITSALNGITAKITDIETNVHNKFVSTFNQTVSQFTQKIDDMAASAQAQFEKQVAQAKAASQDVSDCVAAEKSSFNDTVKAAKQAVQDSATNVQNQLAPVREQATTLFSNALSFVNTTKQQLQDCAKKSLFTQFACYAQVVPSATLQAASIGQQIVQFEANAKIAAANAGISIQNSLQQEVSSASTQISAIVSDGITCIKNKLATTTTAAATESTTAAATEATSASA